MITITKCAAVLIILLYFLKCSSHHSSSQFNNPFDSTFTVKVGQEFTIDLTVSADYSWKLADSNFLPFVEYRKRTFRTLKNLPGSKGIQTFFFIAVKKGETKIEFLFVRPYIKPYPANAERKSYKIIINK